MTKLENVNHYFNNMRCKMAKKQIFFRIAQIVKKKDGKTENLVKTSGFFIKGMI